MDGDAIPVDPSPSSSDTTRKRPRSQTESAQEPSTTYKRGASEDLVMRSSSEVPEASSSTTTDIDAYMADQGEYDQSSLDVGRTSLASDIDVLQASHVLQPHQRLLSINMLKIKPLKEGEIWFLVPKKWYTRFEDACTGRISKDSSSSSPLGPVDNTEITQLAPYPGKEYDLILDPPVVEGDTVEFIPSLAHDFLQEWYGPTKYPHSFAVTPSGPNSTEMTLEIYPRRLRLYRISPSEASPPVYFSIPSRSTLSQLIKNTDFRTDMELYQTNVDRPWGDTTPLAGADFWQNSGERRMLLGSTATSTQLGQTLADALIEQHDSLVAWASTSTSTAPSATEAEVPPAPIFGQNNDYFRKLENKSTSSTFPSTAVTVKKATSVATTSKPGYVKVAKARGTVGLTNLGNTCFMNSALQCLVHLPELSEYFLRDVYKTELNPDNPLSTGGVLARSYGDLVSNLFGPGAGSSCAPRDFKHRISMHAPQFSGYAQHDSQELLAFLLDGLHEDLNRVLKKPYVEKPEWEGGGSKEFLKLATDSWEGYMKRNDSVIVDLFQGQYKSQLVCPECQKVSITFDPFMYLTLPLPIKKTWRHEIFYIPWDSSKSNLSTRVELPANSSIKNLKQKLATMFESDASRLFAIDFWHGKWYKVYTDNDIVSEIQPNDKTVIYELPISLGEAASSQNPEAPFVLPLYHVLREEPSRLSSSFSSTYRRNNYDDKLFGMPTFVILDQTTPITEKSIYDTVLDGYRRWTSRADHLYDWKAPDVPAADSPETEDESEEATTEHATSQETADISMTVEPEHQPILVGPKADLFSITLREESASRYNNKASDTISVSYDGSRTVPWADRRIEPTPEPAPDVEGSDITETDVDEDETHEEDEVKQVELKTTPEVGPVPVQLKPSDMLRVEWDSNTLEYYFGFQGKGDGALWERFTPYVDPVEAAAREANALASAQAAKKNITLEDCLDEFTKEELLGEDDLWYCPSCKKHQQATKQFQLWKVPDVLVVHLKRFSSSRSLRDKIDALVEFPVEGLDLSKWVGEKQFGVEFEKEVGSLEGTGLELVTNEPVLYDLFAVDEHLGGLGGGHYRAYALNADDNQWYHYDDSHVSKARPEDAVNSNAYLLFYRRRSAKPIGGKTHEKLVAAGFGSSEAAVDRTIEPADSQATLATSPSTSTLANMASSFIGPVLPDVQALSHENPDDELPSFEQSQNDSIAIPMTADTLDDDRGAPSPSSSAGASLGASSMRVTFSDESEDDLRGPWIRTIGSGEGSQWSPTFKSVRLRSLSDASDEANYNFSRIDADETVDIDITSSVHSIE